MISIDKNTTLAEVEDYISILEIFKEKGLNEDY